MLAIISDTINIYNDKNRPKRHEYIVFQVTIANGLTGQVSINENGQRNEAQLEILNLRKDKFHVVRAISDNCQHVFNDGTSLINKITFNYSGAIC